MRGLISFVCLLCCTVVSHATAYEDVDVNIYGETNLSKGQQEKLNTSLKVVTELEVFEPPHRRWVLVLTSVINPEIDHFQNELRVNVFTVIGMRF
jgi:hypothetical protein